MNGHAPDVVINRDPLLPKAVAQSLRPAGTSALATKAVSISDKSPSIGQLELNLPQSEPLKASNVCVGPKSEGKRPVQTSRGHHRPASKTEPRAILFADVDGRVQGANRQAILLLESGDGASLIGKSIFELVSPSDRDRLRLQAASVLQNRLLHHGKYSFVDASGQARTLNLSVGVLRTIHQKTNGLLVLLPDISEPKRAEKRMERQRRDLSRLILEAQEAERARMGRDLHDGVNQIIASAKMKLRKLDERSGMLGPALREILLRCDQLLLRALNENRRIANNLHPAELSEFGLAEACRGLCLESESHTCLVVNQDVPHQWHRLNPAVELNLFRIAQESLRNIEQHAHAKSVQFRLGLEGDNVVMKITDDGQGFDLKALKKARSARHGAGLANIRERAIVLGGTCKILSTPKRGTTIAIRIPRNIAREVNSTRKLQRLPFSTQEAA